MFRQASRYAAPGSDQFGRISDELREIQSMTYNRDLTGGAVKGLVSDLMHGTSAADALKNSLGRIADSLMNKTIDSLLNPLFGGMSGSGGGGLGGMLGQAFGFLTGSVSPIPKFADGGMLSGPGGPRSDNLFVRASPGEFIVNAASTSRHLGLLTAINRGAQFQRFADGGKVEATNPYAWANTPPVMMPVATPTAASVQAPTVNFIDQRPAGSPDIQPEVTRRADGSIDVVVKTLESKMTARAQSGRGGLAPHISSAAYRNG